jgi:flagellar FliL protein
VAEEVVEGEPPKSKKPLILAILAILVSLLLMSGGVVGTLFATGFFDKKDKAAAEEKIGAAEGDGKAGAAGGDGGGAAAGGDTKGPAGKASAPAPTPKTTPDMARFEVRYVELEKDLLANLSGSKKVMQVKVAIMTRYDDRVIANIKKHEFALRSVAMDIMRQTKADEIDAPDFRKRLAEKIRDEMNATLQKLEDFGGIEEIVFTNFIVQ